MNSVLQLKGQFSSKGRDGRPGPAEIPSGSSVSSDKIRQLLDQLRSVAAFWENDSLGITPLVRVTYIGVVAKSNRLSRFLLEKGVKSLNSQIVGAEYTSDSNPRHVITYRASLEAMHTAVRDMETLAEAIDSLFSGCITYNDIAALNTGKRSLRGCRFSKSAFACMVKDAYYASSFSVKDSGVAAIKDIRLISIYDTGLSYEELIGRIGGGFRPADKLDDRTWLLSPSQYDQLFRKAPYLIAMSVPDLNEFRRDEPGIPLRMGYSIPKPGNEPVIGVIDTLFCKDVYFSDWVEYHPMVDESIIEDEDYVHGTEVSSLIVDGPTLNRGMDDGCGRFRVRHFGIAKHGRMSSVSIIRSIESIVAGNRDIKVWNLSLGSDLPIQDSFISPEAAVLDRLQYENDVIFVVAGTNNRSGDGSNPPIGAPADSINAITVNSVDFQDRPTSYTRRGPVLRFFNKPDVSVWGGTAADRIQVYGPRGAEKKYGTSFAAPWISRKLAYLMHVMNLTREAAKALIIDSAAGWNTDISNILLSGYGRVPLKISDIISSRDDEIRFFINGTVREYDTFTPFLPVPSTQKGFPYRFKVTMCYFPRCSRNQGVDYTDTELDIHFGRYREDGSMNSINKNKQGDPVYLNLPETRARSEFRKWDNVKHITEGLSDNARIKRKKKEGDIYWGMSIKAVERLDDKPGRGIPFSAVVTMRAIDGINRISQFIKLCSVTHSWDVVQLDQKAMVEAYNEAEANLDFDE